MSKRRIRPGVERVYEYNRVIKIVPQVEVARLLKQKKAVEIYRNGVYMGIRLVEYKTIAAARTAVVDADRVGTRSVLEDADARRSCVVLSRAAVESLADRSRSKTAGLPWISYVRDQRVADGLPEMDFAESAQVKFGAMFPKLKVA